eukprot:10299883-Alexandrium_andersonii.AAC.1
MLQGKSSRARYPQQAGQRRANGVHRLFPRQPQDPRVGHHRQPHATSSMQATGSVRATSELVVQGCGRKPLLDPEC